MSKQFMREIIPLTNNDCFTIFSRVKKDFDFPIHSHEEYELNFVKNAKGVMRHIGDHAEEIRDLELVLVGPNIPHAWTTHHCNSKKITEVTIQFHKDLLDDKFLNRNQMNFIRNMLETSSKGILFSRQTTEQIAGRIEGLNQKQGFDSVLELLSILHDLSLSRNMQTLSSTQYGTVTHNYKSKKIEAAHDFLQKNFHRNITLKEVSKLANMNEVSFSRFFKMQTGITFMDSLLDIRLGNASRLLIDTSDSVSEIAYDCGFNNISNFNRLFKKRKGCTPKEFRDNFSYGNRVFI